jgi:hypothetical protein
VDWSRVSWSDSKTELSAIILIFTDAIANVDSVSSLKCTILRGIFVTEYVLSFQDVGTILLELSIRVSHLG